MVHLILSSTKGNQGLRYFPYSGYLGLSPVKVEGVVRTKIDDDAKQLLAKSITISVRCYESRLGRVSVLSSNVLVDYTQVLWSKPDGVEYTPIDNLEFPFRITLPSKVAGFSTAIFVEYRCMWRIEAVLNHIPIAGIGSRQIKHFELPLVRYDIPQHPLLTSLDTEPFLYLQTTKPRAPRLRYTVKPPTHPIGPLDIVSIPIYLLPMDPELVIRSATVIIERRIQLTETADTSSVPLTPTTPYIFPSSPGPSSPSFQGETHTLSSAGEVRTTDFNSTRSTTSVNSDSSSSNPTITPHSVYPSLMSSASDAPLLPPPSGSPSAPTKTILTPVAGAESIGQFVRDGRGVWSKTISLQWPASKSHSRWAIGETIKSDMVSVKFFVRVKVVVVSAAGTDTVDLAEKEIFVVSTNEGERQVAITKYNEYLDNHAAARSARSKSKSPRRSKPDRDSEIPPPPAPQSSTFTVAASSAGNPKNNKVSAPRRPHTSAGPRDKALDYARAKLDGSSHQSGDDADVFKKHKLGRPETSQSSSQVEGRRKSGLGSRGYYNFFSPASPAPRMNGNGAGSSSSASNNSATTSRSTSSSHSAAGDEAKEQSDVEGRMREWEDELAKIEMRSRKSSDMLGFMGRKRSTGAPKLPGLPGHREQDR